MATNPSTCSNPLVSPVWPSLGFNVRRNVIMWNRKPIDVSGTWSHRLVWRRKNKMILCEGKNKKNLTSLIQSLCFGLSTNWATGEIKQYVTIIESHFNRTVLTTYPSKTIWCHSLYSGDSKTVWDKYWKLFNVTLQHLNVQSRTEWKWDLHLENSDGVKGKPLSGCWFPTDLLIAPPCAYSLIENRGGRSRRSKWVMMWLEHYYSLLNAAAIVHNLYKM